MAITTDAHGSRHLTNAGATEVAGKVGNCAYIGALNYLALGTDAGIEFVGVDFYVAMWVRWDSLTGAFQVPATKRPGATTGGEWQLRVGPGDLLQFLAYGTGGDAVIDCSVTPVVNTWYFIECGVKDGGTTAFLAVNRGADETAACAIDEVGSDLYIGSDAAGNGLLGKIDQFAIYNAVPDSTYRNHLYNSGTGRAYADLSGTTNLVAFWELGDSGAPVATVSASTTTIAENGGTASVVVLLDSSAGSTITVNLGFSGSATLNTDYSASSTSIAIASGDTSGSVSITAIDDSLHDDDETILVSITSATGATIGGASSASITIINDDQLSGFPRSLIDMGFLTQNQTSEPLLFLMVDEQDNRTPKTGLSPTVTLSKNGGSFASPSGAVSEVGSGWYKVAGNATDSNTLGVLVLHATAAGAAVVDMVYQVIAPNFRDSVRLGLTSLANAAAGASGGLVIGSGAGTLAITAGGAGYSVDHAGANVASATNLSTAQTAITAIKTKTDFLPSVASGASGGLLLGSISGTLTIDSGGHAYADARKWLGTAIAAVDTAGYPKVTIKSGSGTGEITLSSGTVRAVDASGANIATSTALATAQTSINSLATTTQLADSSAAILTGINDLKATGSALLATTGAILDDTGVSGVIVAAGSKSGYALSATGLDLIPITDPGVGIANYDTWPTFLVGLFQAQISHATQKSTSAGTITIFGSDGTTANLTMGYTSAGGIDRKGAAT